MKLKLKHKVQTQRRQIGSAHIVRVRLSKECARGSWVELRKRGEQVHCCEQRTPENCECSSAFSKNPFSLWCSGVLASVARLTSECQTSAAEPSYKEVLKIRKIR